MSVKYGILTLLFNQKRHGYELKLGLDSLIGIKGKTNPGQVYTTLDRLIRDDLVAPLEVDDEERKLFELKIKGENELKKWLLEPVSHSDTRDSFFFKWSCAREIQFEEEPKMLKQQKEIILKEVMELTKLKTDYLIHGEENKYLLASGTLFHLEADLNWIAQVENRNH